MAPFKKHDGEKLQDPPVNTPAVNQHPHKMPRKKKQQLTVK